MMRTAADERLADDNGNGTAELHFQICVDGVNKCQMVK